MIFCRQVQFGGNRYLATLITYSLYTDIYEKREKQERINKAVANQALDCLRGCQ